MGAYLAPKAKNYQSWNITKEGVKLNIDACTVFACSERKQVVTIPFTVLSDKLNLNGPITLFVE